MFLSSGFLLLLHCLLTTAASLEERTNGDVCQHGLYGELVPVLKPFSGAQAYCAQAYPAKCRAQRAVKVRNAPPSSSTTRSKSTPSKSTTSTLPSTTPKTTTTKPVNPEESAWSRLLQQEKGVVATICSCIQDPKVKDGLMRLRWTITDRDSHVQRLDHRPQRRRLAR